MSRALRTLRIAAVVCVALLAYSNAVQNEFVYDDGAQILRNHYIRDTSHLRAIWTTNVWSFLGPHAVSNYYRPVMHLIYMADYALFGYSPAGYHGMNIAIHALNAILVLLLGEALLLPAAVPFIAALLFATHPMGTEAVTWVAGVPELSYALFWLLALLAYARSRPVVQASGSGTNPIEREGAGALIRRTVWLIVSVAATLLALFSKETALMLLPVIVLYEHLIRLRARGSALHTGARSALFYLPHAGAVAFYLAMRIRSLGGFQVATNPYGVLTPAEHVFSVLCLYGKYVWKLLAPSPFNIFYVFYPARSLADWRVWAGLAVLAACAAAAWVLWRRRQPLAIAFAVLFLPLVPVMDMRAIGHNVFAERYLYLPMVGFCWLLAALLAYVYTRRPVVAVCLLVLLLGNYALLARSRNTDWHDDLTLYSRTLRAAPDANLIRDNLGQTYLNGYGRPDLALAAFAECTRRAPNRAEYWYDLAQAYGELHRYHEAFAALDRSLAVWKNYPEVYLGRGDLFRDLGNMTAAEQAYRQAIKMKSGYAEAHSALGVVLRAQGRNSDAEASFRLALECTDLADAHLQLGLLFLDQARYADAENSFRHVLISDPHSVVALCGLGRALNGQGKPAEASRYLEAALNESKFAHPRRLGRAPLPDPATIERDLATIQEAKSI